MIELQVQIFKPYPCSQSISDKHLCWLFGCLFDLLTWFLYLDNHNMSLPIPEGQCFSHSTDTIHNIKEFREESRQEVLGLKKRRFEKSHENSDLKQRSKVWERERRIQHILNQSSSFHFFKCLCLFLRWIAFLFIAFRCFLYHLFFLLFSQFNLPPLLHLHHHHFWSRLHSWTMTACSSLLFFFAVLEN